MVVPTYIEIRRVSAEPTDPTEYVAGYDDLVNFPGRVAVEIVFVAEDGERTTVSFESMTQVITRDRATEREVAVAEAVSDAWANVQGGNAP